MLYSSHSDVTPPRPLPLALTGSVAPGSQRGMVFDHFHSPQPVRRRTGETRHLRAIIATTVIIGILIIIVTIWFARRRAKKRAVKESKEKRLSNGEATLVASRENMLGENFSRVKFQEFVLYKIEELAAATGNFGDATKLGRGGFGPVYKGTLPNGQEIAIKRLSRASGQGQQEFMNEMVVICKIQHRNLVRLLGCCVEGDDKMLIYEFMPNKSLDTFLFDPAKRVHLDWRTRFNIIDGICRGLLYLHRDSRLTIIHRDLKASNILLDEELNPKISDFGMARIFGRNENQANTRRVVGTYGYMAPEYAMEGRFSEKSDVFSFGILLLEIISGKRNTSFYEEDQFLSLLGQAWQLWNEDNILALVDPNIPVRCFKFELLRDNLSSLKSSHSLVRTMSLFLLSRNDSDDSVRNASIESRVPSFLSHRPLRRRLVRMDGERVRTVAM
ncbi:hypothetical protein NL676_013024 [Syzygium grande]|nr:hypothetical protein NL676_013024 [Syzygium grande]